MTDDNVEYREVNGHKLMRMYSRDVGLMYICDKCKIKGPNPQAFEDISSCEY